MATKIVTKNSSTASAVPTASDLVQGELAVNVADKRLFTEDNGGSIVELGTKPSTIDINAGSIDGTAIGASSASTGAFTTLTATGLTVDTDTLYVDSTNNRVGIGTSSPSALLDVSANGSSIMRLSDSSSPATYAEFKQANGILSFNADAGTGQSSSAIKFLVDNAESMRIDSSGNVGIGTTSPASTLEIAKNDQTNGATLSITNSFNGGSWSSGDTVGKIDFRIDDVSTTEPVRASIKVFDDLSGGSNTYPYASALSISTTLSNTATERLRIDSSGNVGIGTSSPSFVTGSGLEIQRSSADATLRLEHTGQHSFELTAESGQVTYNSVSSKNHVFEVGSSEKMRIDSSGQLLIGRTSSSASAEDNGVVLSPSGYAYLARTGTSNQTHVSFINNAAVSATVVGTIKTSGSSTSYNTSSDQRLKENIADADDAGSKIDAIQVRKFDWKVDGSHQDYGMIAQELVEVAPEAVDVPEESEEMMGVDFSKLVPMLIKEIQSLRNRVAQLEE